MRSVCSTMRRLRVPALPAMRSSSSCIAEAAEGFGRLVDDRQERRQHREMLDVVEADEAHVLRDRQAALAQRLHGADRGHVVDREDGGRQRRRAPAPAAWRDSRRSGRPSCGRRARRDRRCRPLRAPRDSRCSRSRPVEVSSASVRCAMSRWPTAIRCSTRRRAPEALSLTTRSQSRSGKARSMQHERESRRAAAGRRCGATVAGRREQQPLDAMRDQVLDIFALEAEVALAVAEKHAIAGLARSASRRRARPARRTD